MCSAPASTTREIALSLPEERACIVCKGFFVPRNAIHRTCSDRCRRRHKGRQSNAKFHSREAPCRHCGAPVEPSKRTLCRACVETPRPIPCAECGSIFAPSKVNERLCSNDCRKARNARKGRERRGSGRLLCAVCREGFFGAPHRKTCGAERCMAEWRRFIDRQAKARKRGPSPARLELVALEGKRQDNERLATGDLLKLHRLRRRMPVTHAAGLARVSVSTWHAYENHTATPGIEVAKRIDTVLETTEFAARASSVRRELEIILGLTPPETWGRFGPFDLALRAAMEREHCTIAKLAELTGVYRTTISEYRNGVLLPNVAKLQRFCAVLGDDLRSPWVASWARVQPTQGIMRPFGVEVAIARRAAGFTLRKLEKHSGVDADAIRQIERGFTVPRTITATTLIDALSLDAADARHQHRWDLYFVGRGKRPGTLRDDEDYLP